MDKVSFNYNKNLLYFLLLIKENKLKNNPWDLIFIVVYFNL